jgi:hypothetical protein
VPRLSRSELARVEEIASSLATVRIGDPPALETLVPAVRELLGAEKAASYLLTPGDDGLRIASLVTAGAPRQLVRESFESLLAATRDRKWNGMPYNPYCPEPEQRNRVRMHHPGSDGTPASVRSYYERFPAILESFRKVGVILDQIRVLVCDGPVLLAWVGAFRSDPFTWREQQLLTRLTEPLRKRLTLERHLQEAPLSFATISTLLEAVGMPAFIATPAGAVKHDVTDRAM